jgi:hypothetical protein
MKKKYLLTMLGDVDSELCNFIANELTPIVDSPNLKYHYIKGSMLLHFESEVEQDEIHDFIGIITFNLITTYILVELTDKVSVNMPKIYSEHLFDLEKNHRTEEIISNTLEEVDDEDYSENVALLLEEIKSKVKKPSLDFLLEKIKSKGINSLSQFEKDTLNEYSKN